MKLLFTTIIAASIASPCWASSVQTSTINTMAIQSPCSTTIMTANQKTAPALTNIAIADVDATVTPSIIPIKVQAPGMVNIEVWTHGKKSAQLVGDGAGNFTGNLDLTAEAGGPILLGVFAWNSAPGDNSYTVNLVATMDLIVAGSPPKPPAPLTQNLVISGTPQVGQTLTASQTLVYQWYRDGGIIVGQNGPAYGVIPPPNKSGGTWPAFWMLTANAVITHDKSGNIEEDITEMYGEDPSFWQAGQHTYAGATGPGVGIFSGRPIGDLTWDFHRFGLLITDTTLTSYLDDKPYGSLAKDQLVGGVPIQWYVLLDLAWAAAGRLIPHQLVTTTCGLIM